MFSLNTDTHTQTHSSHKHKDNSCYAGQNAEDLKCHFCKLHEGGCQPKKLPKTSFQIYSGIRKPDTQKMERPKKCSRVQFMNARHLKSGSVFLNVSENWTFLDRYSSKHSKTVYTFTIQEWTRLVYGSHCNA